MSDYGGKTREQEADDSITALGWMLLFIISGVLAIIGLLLAWWLV